MAGWLVDIGVFTQEDRKVYEIEMVVDNKEFDVLFSSAGKVLCWIAMDSRRRGRLCRISYQ